MLEGYPLISRFSVPFADIDMMQHVNNVAYLRWAEALRSEYFARVMGGEINGPNGIIQATISFTYERQIAYREIIGIGCRIPRLGHKSFDIEYTVWSETHGRRAAHGITTMVAFDFQKQATIEISQAWRNAIASFEGGPQQEYR